LHTFQELNSSLNRHCLMVEHQEVFRKSVDEHQHYLIAISGKKVENSDYG